MTSPIHQFVSKLTESKLFGRVVESLPTEVRDALDDHGVDQLVLDLHLAVLVGDDDVPLGLLHLRAVDHTAVLEQQHVGGGDTATQTRRQGESQSSRPEHRLLPS